LNTLIAVAHDHGPEHFTVREITLRLLVISWAALHTTANTLSHSIVNLSETVNGVDLGTILYSELNAVLNNAVETGGSVHWTKKNLSLLTGMSSFLKETLRLYMVGSGIFCRKVRTSHLPGQLYIF
jgi:cytochrome P450